MKKTSATFVLAVLAGLGAAAWAFHQGDARQQALLHKIGAVGAQLAAGSAQRARGNTTTLRGLSVAVARNGYQPRDVAVLKQSEQILGRSRSLADTLRQWQRAVRADAHESASGALQRPQAATPLAAARAKQLAQSLNRYARFIQAYVPGAPILAPPQSPRPETTWLYREGAPLAAALGSLARLEAETHRLAQDALTQQAQKIGSCCIFFDKIGALAVAVSNTVAPGGTYEARLFMTHSASSQIPKMSVEGRPVHVGYDGRGTVEFRVPPLRPGQPDTVRAHWRGHITVRSYPTDSTIQLDVPYYIVKPRSR
ncbi:hypothetical protein ACFST9_03240 [Hymenobacter monticola]|uniref:Gliding motility-associated protein GldM first immunoglobulin-like domain-containing protein n=1 Tax=Hymenobacter monticola TaxID=1705399 RepID=A0ABY4B1L9_9BACT|nr:hypothetical protein [Hymenobacter monticola]UOE33027.1 hypothetical protein MTP16_18085 [Hymenobacter monticola]